MKKISIRKAFVLFRQEKILDFHMKFREHQLFTKKERFVGLPNYANSTETLKGDTPVYTKMQQEKRFSLLREN